MSDPTSELLAAFVAATPERKAAAVRVLKGLAIAADPTEPKPADGPLLLGMGAAAKYLGVSRATLWRAVKGGRLEKVELFPGSYRIRRTDVEELARQTTEGGSASAGHRGQPRKSSQKALQRRAEST